MVMLLYSLIFAMGAGGELNSNPFPLSPHRDSLNMVDVGTWPFGYSLAIAIDTTRGMVFLSSGSGVLEFRASYDSVPPIISDKIRTSVFIRGLFYADGKLYITGTAGVMEIWDVSDPAMPQRLSDVDTRNNWTRGIFVRGNYAYILLTGGMSIYDVSDSRNPLEIGYINLCHAPQRIIVRGDYAYIACGSSGFSIVNISDPRNPQLVSSVVTYGTALGIALSGNYAYIVDMAGSMTALSVYDISDPANPHRTGILSMGGEMHNVDVSGNYAYAADYYAGLRIFDVSDPDSPTQISVTSTYGNAVDVMVWHDRAYIADWIAGFTAVNVSDPQTPTLCAHYDVAGQARDIFVRDTIAFLADGDNGLVILDVSNPRFPEKISSYDTPGTANGVFVDGELAYVTDGDSGVRIISVQDLENPVEIGHFDTSNALFSANSIVVRDGYAYVAYGYGKFVVLDVSNPQHPRVVARVRQIANGASGVFVSGNFAYVTTSVEPAMFYVIDISHPSNPQVIGSLTIWGDGKSDVVVRDTLAYVATPDGFNIIDVSDPTAPRLLSTMPGSGSASGVAVIGNYALITRLMTSYEGYVDMVDISDPSHPQEVANYHLPSASWDIASDGKFAYVADGESGMWIIGLPVPNTIRPSYGDTVHTSSIEFVWHQPNYFESGAIYSLFVDSVPVAEGISDTVLDYDGLQPGDHMWHVVVHHADGDSFISMPAQFVVVPPSVSETTDDTSTPQLSIENIEYNRHAGLLSFYLCSPGYTEELKISILNIAGRKLKYTRLPVNHGWQMIEIKSFLPIGVYILDIRSNNDELVKKFEVIR